MKMVEFETHCHTKESSICGQTGARELMHAYAKLGCNTVIITDHYYENTWNTRKMKKKSWEECIDQYLLGYHTAKDEGEKIGLNVLMGMEVQVDGGAPYDFLIYGPEEDFLKEHPYLNRFSLPELYELIHKNGYLMFQAHPYRYGGHPVEPITYDGIEVYNAHIAHESHNERAVRFAAEHELLMIAGSDCHIAGGSARGGVMMPEDVRTIRDFVDYYKENGSPELIISWK